MLLEPGSVACVAIRQRRGLPAAWVSPSGSQAVLQPSVGPV